MGIFGNTEFARKMAKKGTTNDIAIYNHASSEGVFTYAHPNSEKIQPLLQVIGMIDVPVIVLSEITKEVGEQFLALDAAGFSQGFIIADGVLEDQIKDVVKGSSLEKWPILTNDPTELRQRILKTEIDRDTESAPWIPIDNYFSVKGIGTVALCIMKRGRIKKYDVLRLEPLGKDVTLKGLQSQDRHVDEAEAGMRLGLNLKGVETDELSRGYVICKEADTSKEITATFTKSKFSKEKLETGSKVFIASGLQVISSTMVNIEPDRLHLRLEHPLVYKKGQKCIFASTKPTLPRILGHGSIV